MVNHTSSLMSDTDSLIRRVHDLPPELHSKIRDLILSTDFKGTVCKINEDYKPPSVLQVSQTWRKELWSMFYRNATFVTTDSEEGLKNLTQWLESLADDKFLRVDPSYIHIHCEKKLTPIGFETGKDGVITHDQLTNKDRNTLQNLRFRIAHLLCDIERSLVIRLSVQANISLRFLTAEGYETWWVGSYEGKPQSKPAPRRPSA